MFTGIVEELGILEDLKKGNTSSTVKVACKKVLEDVSIGDSIAVNGVCLTVKSFSKSHFEADVMNETFSKTNFEKIKKGSRLNLERALSLNTRLGGHIVTGHIDFVGTIVSIKKDANAVWFGIKSKHAIDLTVTKGSIAIDGISLTVAKIEGDVFYVSLIPHSFKNTVLGYKKVGDLVNLETDILGKYVFKLLNKDENQKDKQKKQQNIDEKLLDFFR